MYHGRRGFVESKEKMRLAFLSFSSKFSLILLGWGVSVLQELTILQGRERYKALAKTQYYSIIYGQRFKIV